MIHQSIEEGITLNVKNTKHFALDAEFREIILLTSAYESPSCFVNRKAEKKFHLNDSILPLSLTSFQQMKDFLTIRQTPINTNNLRAYCIIYSLQLNIITH